VAKRILLIRLSHLGDVVLALPVFHALRARYPEARIAWVTQPEFAGLLTGLPGLERIFLFARGEGAAAWPRLVEDLGGFAPDLVVDAQGNLKSAAVALCAGSARRTGLHRRDWREPLGALVLHDHAPPVERDVVHAMDRMFALARHACGSPAVGIRTDPALLPEELEQGRARWRELVGAHQSAVILQLCDPGDVRSWPVEHFASLARLLGEHGFCVLCISGPREADVGRALERELAAHAHVRHWVGQRGLRELAALYTAAAAVRAPFVGTDSGPMHLAAACGMRVVALVGPQSHLRTGPWPIPGSDEAAWVHSVIGSPNAPDCAPCLARRCTHPEGPVCMRELPPAMVAEQLAGVS